MMASWRTYDVKADAVSWRFCAVLARANPDSKPGERRFMIRWMIGFIGLSSLGTLAAFAYALRNVSAGIRWEVIEGTVIAVGVLTMGGWLIFKAFQFFEEQSAIELEQQQRDQEERERNEEE